MVEHTQSFGEFWGEIRRPFALGSIKTLVLFPVAVLIAIPVVQVFQCVGWMGNESQRITVCAELLNPTVLISNIMAFVPTLLKGTLAALPWVFLAVLYLEWDKYKKDEASWFTHGKGCEGPPGYTRRLKWVMAASWDIDAHTLVAVEMGERHKRYEGQFSEDALLREIRRKFARSENKPTEDTETSIRWRIVQNNGREVHIHLQRQPIEPVTWVMTTQFYEWAGRRQPPRLAQTHTTEFVLQATNEGQSSAEG
jgi:hypothetical protein